MGILDTLQQESTISKASGNNYQYVVLWKVGVVPDTIGRQV